MSTINVVISIGQEPRRSTTETDGITAEKTFKAIIESHRQRV